MDLWINNLKHITNRTDKCRTIHAKKSKLLTDFESYYKK